MKRAAELKIIEVHIVMPGENNAFENNFLGIIWGSKRSYRVHFLRFQNAENLNK